MDLHIKDVLKKYIKQDKRIEDAYYSNKILEIWKNQFSESISKRTVSLKFHKGKLTVKVDSAPLRNELFNNREKIIQRLNEFLSEDIIKLLYVC